jgi:hypothetical protein
MRSKNEILDPDIIAGSMFSIETAKLEMLIDIRDVLIEISESLESLPEDEE